MPNTPSSRQSQSNTNPLEVPLAQPSPGAAPPVTVANATADGPLLHTPKRSGAALQSAPAASTMNASATADSTQTASSARRRPASSARKVLTRPLRSVGRRLSGRFTSTGQRKRKQDAKYGSLDQPLAGSPLDSNSMGMPRPNGFVESAVSSLRQMASPVGDRGLPSGSAFCTVSAVQRSRNWIVYSLEHFLRHVCLLLAAYCAGVYRPGWVGVARKLAEYGVVALITCWFIIVAAACQGKYQSVLSDDQGYYDGDLEEEFDDLIMDELRPLLPELSDEPPAAMGQRDLEAADQEGVGPNSPVDLFPIQKVVHPSLGSYFTIDSATERRVFPNAAQVFPLDTDFYSGSMMVLIRTPDVDDPSAPKGTDENDAMVNYFTGKQRRFEFQFQIRLKKVPTGRVYFACELEESFKMGMIQRAFVGAAMAFVKTTNSSFHYNMTGSAETEDGRYEKPHMAFPVERSMDRCVVTRPGQTTPTLGEAIYEDPESIKQRKKGVLMEWNTSDTYTLALWSAYVDFLEWKCINLPGIRPFDLCNVIGSQPIILTIYEIPENRGNEKHYIRDISGIARIEMSNSAKSGIGRSAKQWRIQHQDTLLLTNNAVCGQGEDFALEDIQEESDDDDDAATLAELGEGIYVQSGDTITLRGSSIDETSEGNDEPCYVNVGAGFAILQERNSTNVIIEKVERSRAGRNAARSKLIKSGDTVMFKVTTRGRNNKSEEVTETRYLTIHRGWWLKWVGTAPTKNGFFTIHTHETEFSEHGSTELRAAETQSSYLSLGGSFWLQHKRWKRNLVGVAAEGSATYGGRILGLYTPKNAPAFPEDNNISGDEMHADPEQPEAGERDKSDWMVPLILRAYEGINTVSGTGIPQRLPSSEYLDNDILEEEKPRLVFSSEGHRMDVPAWLEIMNRTERVRQLTYVVRVLPPEQQEKEDDEDSSTDVAFLRLRTGRELAPAVRTGLNWRNSTSPREKKPPEYIESSRNNDHESDTPLTPSPRRSWPTRKVSNPSDRDIARLSSYSFDEVEGIFDSPKAEDSSDDEWEGDASEDPMDLIDDTEDPDAPTGTSDNRSKGRKLIGKIAKSVKNKTTSTGKTMVRQSVKVGKGTVNAGKAISRIAPIRPKNPRSVEPKSAKTTERGGSRRRREKDLHVAVGRTTKQRDRFESTSSLSGSPHILAGQLSAPEQSCRSVSNMLSIMSDLPPTSTLLASFSSLLSAQVENKTAQDDGFLSGGAIQVGVVPSKGGLSQGSLLSGCLVARCLWESHWREEWLGLYESGLAFYAPLSRSPCLELSFADIQSLRYLSADARTPLPGYPILVIETAWLCHYAAFADEGAREAFRLKIEETKLQFVEQSDPKQAERERQLWKARFWQGFQSSIESSLSSGKGKWAEVVSGTKSKRRTVINNRRMVFDLKSERVVANKFVENLLSTCLSFSLDSLEEHPEELLQFLDSASKLRSVSLDQVDLASESAFCMFVNLYHCLLQHALFISVNGPLHKRSFGHFMRTSCYEIGGDVFSLAEFHCCIIRGHMSRPIVPKAPYIDVSKKSDAYRHFALAFSSPCVNFLLNTGDVSCPREVFVLRPWQLEAQMHLSAGEFLRRNLILDGRKTIFIPKLCEVYRNDFAGDSAGAAGVCLQYCLRYAPEPLRTKISNLLKEEPSIAIKYLSAADQFHAYLTLAQVDEEMDETFKGKQLPSGFN